ncbi:DNA-binding response regulator, NarL/FixJ family, contains REC and HTH domains [Bradyrhizobium brasilense]|uniref:DNA-binding response regulator, NarL/FixJ family, contains REC and HTH domains n=1 Tax=Bradyrhizobium brasilense TaxID=1419277 RepID=A0A1G7PP38_9BRAD|nr:response regulator transcription factor [Bradyrhizobium brasilense]SDF87998.1 DNA-binding response regulator, NarL/FixJ family, contains REC and HTH domains [Bradyrhizobium brasilense]
MVTNHTSRPSTSVIKRNRKLAATSLTKIQAKLVIATRNEITAAGMKALLHAAGYRVAAHCTCEDDLLRSLDTYRPDIIMLAETVVGRDAVRVVSRVRDCNFSLAIIFLVECHDAIAASDLLVLDVEGILLSGAACARSFIDCVGSVQHGRKWIDPDLLRQLATAERSSIKRTMMRTLTSREADIAHFVSRGLHNKQIARALDLSEGTVKMHLHHIYEKLGLEGRMQLALSMTGVCGPVEPTAPDLVVAVRR